MATATLSVILAGLLPDILAGEDGFLINSTVNRAVRVAPCIAADDFPFLKEAADILVEAVRRRDQQRRMLIVPGVSVTEQTGGRARTVDGKSIPTGYLWPSEISELQALCRDVSGLPVEGPSPAYTFPDPQPWPA